MNIQTLLASLLLLTTHLLFLGCKSDADDIRKGDKTAYVVMESSGKLVFTSYVVTVDGTTYEGTWDVSTDDPQYNRYMSNLPGLRPGEKRKVEPWSW